MRSIRIGNDIDLHWSIFTGDGLDEVPYDMTGKDISLYAQTRATDIFEVVEFTIDKHIIKWRFKGKEQRSLGVYKITLIENKGKDNMHTIDECKAFQLVDDSCKATCDLGNDDNFRITTLQFRSKMSVGGAVNITVDDALSTESVNPVQNKIITATTNDIVARLGTCIKYVPQTLAEEQKEQVRNNIGAASTEYVLALFNELKDMILSGGSGGTTMPDAILDNAILNNVKLV